MTWDIFKETKLEWQKHFVQFNGHYRQSFDWGEYKKLMGWKILRLQKIDKFKKKTLIQLTYKKFSIFSAIYIPGHISGDVSLLNNELRNAIKKYTNSIFLYVRFDNNSTSYDLQNEVMIKNGWKRPIHREHTSKTLELEIDKEKQNFLNNIKKNWKKSYKKSMKRLKENKISYKITNDPNVKELVLVDKIMTRSRKIYTNHSENEFRFLINTARSNVVFIIAYSLEGDPLSFRSMIYFDEKGWDLGGATTPKGKKALVDYFIMVELLNKASSLNVKHYNLGDIGKEKNIGVHNFKKGVGGKELIYSGEWEWSNVPFLRITINFIIFLLMLNIMRKFFPSINNIRF